MAVGMMGLPPSSLTRCNCSPSNHAAAELDVPKSRPMPNRFTPSPTKSTAQIGAANLRIRTQCGGVVLQDHPPRLEHKAMRGDLQREVRILLHQQDGDAVIAVD